MPSMTDIRNRHLIAAAQNFIASLPENFYIDIAAVGAAVAAMPAPCYYCNYVYALRMLYIYRHGALKACECRRAPLWKELSDKVDDVLKCHGGTVSDALAIVLARGKASQFFISPLTAAGVLRRYYDPATRSFIRP